MAFKSLNYVEQEHTGFTGTGEYTDSGAAAPTARVTVASGFSTGDVGYFVAIGRDSSSNDAEGIEVFLGTKTATGLARTTIIASTNANAAVNWSTAAKVAVMNTIPASKLFQLDDQLSLTLPLALTPATPAADNLAVYMKKQANRAMLAIMGPSGLDTTLQPFLGGNKVKWWNPAGNATTITAEGAAALTATGTATAVNVAVTNIYTRQRALEYLVTTAATTAVAGFRDAVAQMFRGAAAGEGGFFIVVRWGPSTGVATTTNRAFVGLTSATTAPTDVQPSSLTNMIGMGWDAADTNIQMMTNDGTGTATKTDLGASFPVPTADRTKSYELALFCAPGGTTVYWQVTDLGTNATSTGSITTDYPANTTLLALRGWMSAGGTSSVIGIALMNGYIETDS